MIYAAKVMARFGARLLEEPEILTEAKREFLEETNGKSYQCTIPETVAVP
jgi:aminobenzoyl-glutamate utilization protein B